MNAFLRTLPVTLIFFAAIVTAANGQKIDKKTDPAQAAFVSLDGQALTKGNSIEKDGNVHTCKLPLLRLERTKSGSPKGTILLIPGGGYEMLKVTSNGKETAPFLNGIGYDVAILDYPVTPGPVLPGSPIRDQALIQALKAFRLLRTNYRALGLHGDRLSILSYASGGHLAARAVQKLGGHEQPNDLVLLFPSYLDETMPGTVFPAIMPPVHPTARLFAASSGSHNQSWVTACSEYAKVWKGYDGQVTYRLVKDSVHESVSLVIQLSQFLGPAAVPGSNAVTKMASLDAASANSAETPNPAAIPVVGYSPDRHAEKLKLVASHKFDLIMLGNSITNNFEKSEFQPVWKQFFAPRNAVNLGFSGYRTEHLLWNIRNGELDGQSPKVVVLEIGTNNIDEKNYPMRHTAAQLAGGITAIVTLLRQKVPGAKIVILRCFPGCYGGPNPTSHRAILERASDMVSGLADGKNIFYCDVNHVFLNPDGSINHDLMPDWLHPSPAGAKAWAQAMEPLLSQLMGDKSLDTEIPVNTAIVPVSKLEKDSYNWWDRHAEVLRIKDSIDPEIVLIGNSITHFWGGLPELKNADGQPRTPNGPKSWAGLFGPYRVLNLGFGWDRTQNVLWRLDHGELDGLHPRTVIINIGTNNTSQTPNARMNTAPEIVEGIRSICGRVRSKVPGAKIILMAVFPREQDPANPRRVLIGEINRLLAIFAKEQQLTFIDIGPGMLAADGTFLPGMMSDFTHPTDKGYQVWADALSPILLIP